MDESTALDHVAGDCVFNDATLRDYQFRTSQWTLGKNFDGTGLGPTLEPGDVIACGTPSGVGFARTPPLWMAPGDVCEVEIEQIGRLRNPVVQD